MKLSSNIFLLYFLGLILNMLCIVSIGVVAYSTVNYVVHNGGLKSVVEHFWCGVDESDRAVCNVGVKF